MFPQDPNKATHFGMNFVEELLCFSQCITSENMMWVCSIIGSVDYYYLVKMVHAGFLHSGYLIINKQLICNL